MSRAHGVCCSVCECINKAALVCPTCVNQTLLFERRKMLLELGERREALLQQLNAVIAQRQTAEALNVRRHQAAAAAKQARERVCQAERVLEAAKREADRLRAVNAVRRAAHDRVSSDLAARRADHLLHHPTLLRYQALTYSHVAAMLLAEQRAKLAVLLDTLPLRVSAIMCSAHPGAPGAGAGSSTSGSTTAAAHGASGSGGAQAAGPGTGSVAATAIQVTVCNLKLPDSSAVSNLMGEHPEATSSALGYLLLLQELLATYLGGPLLHEGAFQGSTSVVWQQHSFWNRRPSSSNARLPLFLEEGSGPGLGSSLGNPFASKARPAPSLQGQQHAQPQASGSASSAFSALSRAISGSAPGGASGGAAHDRHLDEALARQRHTDLKLAYDMLLRSLACFVRDKVHTLGLQLPVGWGPCGWLVVLCAAVRRDPATDSVLAAAQQSFLATAGSGDVRIGGGAGGEADVDEGGNGDEDDEAAEVEEDGWDVVKKPFLPPPPSQPDAVEHWSRAMFTDAPPRRKGGAGRRPAGAGAASLAPAMSLERVRSMFAK